MSSKYNLSTRKSILNANKAQLKTIGPAYGVTKGLFESYKSYRERIIKVIEESAIK